VARETVPAYRGHPETAIGNLLGIVVFIVGIMAIVHPFAVADAVLYLLWPLILGTLLVVSLLLCRGWLGAWREPPC
jgi:Ca2+/Na+ antiporter